MVEKGTVSENASENKCPANFAGVMLNKIWKPQVLLESNNVHIAL